MADELLHVLSHRRELRWAVFRRFVEELGGEQESVSDGPSQATIALHTLKALGHVTVSFFGGMGVVTAAPRVLARLPSLGEPSAVLVGHRVADTVEQLRVACDAIPGARLTIESEEWNLSSVPRRLLVTARCTDDLGEIAYRISARFTKQPAAWRLLEFSCSLNQYLASLDWRERKSPGWPHLRFDPKSLAFVHKADRASDGLHSFIEPDTGLGHYWLRRGLHAAQIDRDWGRWAVLQEGICLVYTPADELAVPARCLLPGLFSCVAAMCSGLAPACITARMDPGRPEVRGWLVYRDVPRIIAQRIVDKLRQTLRVVNRKLCEELAHA
jgi:hypothetical protein